MFSSFKKRPQSWKFGLLGSSVGGPLAVMCTMALICWNAGYWDGSALAPVATVFGALELAAWAIMVSMGCNIAKSCALNSVGVPNGPFAGDGDREVAERFINFASGFGIGILVYAAEALVAVAVIN